MLFVQFETRQTDVSWIDGPPFNKRASPSDELLENTPGDTSYRVSR
jgi:hypothetical protein